MAALNSLQCPSGHTLRCLHVPEDDQAWCSGCAGEQEPGSSIFGCVDCQYGLCLKCVGYALSDGHEPPGECCRICLEEGEEVLISPCPCRGTSAGAHLTCLEKWYRSKGNWLDLHCPSCKHPYQGMAAVILGEIGLGRTEPGSADEAAILAFLGVAYGDCGETEQKRANLERALVIEERLFGEDHTRVATTLGNLGNAYGNLGDNERKKDLLERALAINEKVAPDDSSVAVTLTNLGNAYGALGDIEKKKELLERALAIHERELGKDHPSVAVNLTNLGNAYENLGNTEMQRLYLERALVIFERCLGPNHHHVGITLMNLAGAYADSCDRKEQRRLLERALPILEEHYGPKHTHVKSTVRNLGKACCVLGDARRLQELLEWALALDELGS